MEVSLERPSQLCSDFGVGNFAERYVAFVQPHAEDDVRLVECQAMLRVVLADS